MNICTLKDIILKGCWLYGYYRNSHLELFRQKGAFKNFAKFTGKQLRQSLFLINLLSLKVTLLKKRDSGTGVALWILKNTFFIEHLWWLLLLLIRRQSIRLFRIVAWCCVCFVFIFFPVRRIGQTYVVYLSLSCGFYTFTSAFQ